jgi:GrpB-like predicted nucleotidyltransferase (UPF0157 family)
MVQSAKKHDAAMNNRSEPLSARIQRVLQEKIDLAQYDPLWPAMFEQEKEFLLSILPGGIIRRIEHFGSTAVPGMSAKPIIDMLAEVTDLVEVRHRIVGLLEQKGYEYFWRPSFGDEMTPFYAWFIKRDAQGNRTHHIHMIESHFQQWDALFFRDYLIAHPQCAKRYEDLKKRLARRYPRDRESYTREKGAFIQEITRRARQGND